MRLDRLITLNVVQPCHRVARVRSKASSSAIPILMYHSITAKPESHVSAYYKTNTSPAMFRQHMEFLHTEGYQTLTLSAALDASQRAVTTRRIVVLTFDDGYRDFYTEAFPVLRQHGFTATMFLPTAFIAGFPAGPSEPPADLRYSFNETECMTWNEVRELHRSGIEFGSHTVSHPKLVDLDWPEIEIELRNSKAALELQLNSTVNGFAYPYAFPQANASFIQRFKRLVKSAGYTSCVTTRIGRFEPDADRYELKRLPMNGCDDNALLNAKLTGAYDWLATAQRTIKRLKRLVRRSESSPAQVQPAQA